MILAFGFGEDIPIIVGLLLILFILISIRKYLFKISAKINKIIFPSLYKKDITRLSNYEKVILAYRFWITKNSL